MKNDDVLRACLARELRRNSLIVRILKQRNRPDLVARHVAATLPKILESHSMIRKLAVA